MEGVGGTLQAECGAGAKALRPAPAGHISRSREAVWVSGIQNERLPGVVEPQHGQTVAKLCVSYEGKSQPDQICWGYERKCVCVCVCGVSPGRLAWSLDLGDNSWMRGSNG